MVSKKVFYTGQVQGVGFRYTAQRLANGFAVAGYVRNLSNGQVELVAEGEEPEVQAFLAALGRHMADYIAAISIQDQPVEGFKGFGIRP